MVRPTAGILVAPLQRSLSAGAQTPSFTSDMQVTVAKGKQNRVRCHIDRLTHSTGLRWEQQDNS